MENQDENAGTQALQEGIADTESAIRGIDSARYSHKLKQAEKAVKLEKKADKANLAARYREAMEKANSTSSNPISRWQQRRKIRKEYYEAKNAAQNAAKEALIKAHYNRVCRGNQRQQAKDEAIYWGANSPFFPLHSGLKGAEIPGEA